MNRASRRRQRGMIYIETLITLPLVFYFFLVTWQLIDMMVAGYMVKHAAVCAARAAAVVGPDEPRHYGNQTRGDLSSGPRFDDVNEATWRALKPHKHFRKDLFKLKLEGGGTAASMVKATVNAEYKCNMPALNVVCRGAASYVITANAEFPYQGSNASWDG
jgi:hypothetical protein